MSMHRPALSHEAVQVVGVCDINETALASIAAEFNCPAYTDHRRMIDETKPDVVVVMTPHRSHAPIAMDGLKAGCHVLVEKPIAVLIGEADTMIAAAKEANRILAVNFQQRLRPEIQVAHKLIHEGRLGQIQHVDIKMTWTRAAVYYRMSNWRGLWRGEGGGVLMNQAPHELDLLCYLVGMPSRVMAWTRTILHNIETEDTVQAMMEWDSGTLGSLHISTGEAGQPQRFEIIGTQGHLSIAPGRLDFQRFDSDLVTFVATSDRPFSEPGMQPETIEIPEGKGDHPAIYRNLVEAILGGAPVIADGASAAQSLELANAMTYSSYTNGVVEFPLDREAYADLLVSLEQRAMRSSP
jgi:predicted dehydrogenase